MSRRTCPGCGGQFQRGTAVYLVQQSGELRRAHVCPQCVARATILVTEVTSYLEAVKDHPVPFPKDGR